MLGDIAIMCLIASLAFLAPLFVALAGRRR